MRKYQRFTQEEISSIVNFKEEGLSNEDIASLFGREPRQIKDLLCRLKKRENSDQKKPVFHEAPDLTPAKPEKTLKDFDPRDMLKQLYDLGYRIDEKGIYVMVKQYVNLKSIIND